MSQRLPMNSQPTPSHSPWARFASIAWRGFFMGGADVVPGVSGGTVALVLGIYEHLVTAISRVDRTLLRFLATGRFREAAEYLDLFFLCSLASGILMGACTALVSLSYVLNDERLRQFTWAAFFGMILASGVHLARMVRVETVQTRLQCVIGGVLAAVAAYWISSQTHGTAGDPSLGYIFACASLAICAMILPGISGAMVLLLLGVYEYLTHIPSDILHGEHVGKGLLTILVFAAGCAVSLVCFSKLLRWLLRKYHALTMAMLCGLLLGGLRKLWPFQVDLTPDVDSFRRKSFGVRWPESVGELVAVLVVVVLAAALVFAAEYWVSGNTKHKKIAT